VVGNEIVDIKLGNHACSSSDCQNKRAFKSPLIWLVLRKQVQVVSREKDKEKEMYGKKRCKTKRYEKSPTIEAISKEIPQEATLQSFHFLLLFIFIFYVHSLRERINVIIFGM